MARSNELLNRALQLEMREQTRRKIEEPGSLREQIPARRNEIVALAERQRPPSLQEVIAQQRAQKRIGDAVRRETPGRLQSTAGPLNEQAIRRMALIKRASELREAIATHGGVSPLKVALMQARRSHEKPTRGPMGGGTGRVIRANFRQPVQPEAQVRSGRVIPVNFKAKGAGNSRVQSNELAKYAIRVLSQQRKGLAKGRAKAA